MFLRSILSRIHKHQRFATLHRVENAEPSAAAAAIHPSLSTNKSADKGYVISYLVKQCGLTQEGAISASRAVHFDRPDKPNAVLNFLEEKGFSVAQIADLVAKKPKLLVANPEKTLLRRFEFYVNLIGISEADTLRTLSRNSFYLGTSSQKRVGRVYNYLKDTIGVEKATTLWRRGSWIYTVDFKNRLTPNVEFLRALGVPKSCITLGLYHFGEIFMQKPDKLKETVEEVKQMGFDPSKSTFVLALYVRTGNSNKAVRDKCYETYARWGWTEHDISKAFRKHPLCMTLSEGKVSKTLDFLVNRVGREPQLVADCPYVLFYSLEKRIVPRCSVVLHLVSKGFLKEDWSLTSVLGPKEEKFLKKFVKRYEEKVPCLLDLYEGKASSGDT